MPLVRGTIIKDRYQISSVLGEGGFATVYQANDSKLNRIVAIKILKIGSLKSDEDLERFRREARVLAQAKHPNIVTIYSFEVMDDLSPFIVMEYLEGCSFFTYLAKNKKLGLESIDIFLQISNGLSCAHKLGLVHRDLTPNNIFLIGEVPELSVKIIDFGLSKLISELGSDKLTRTGALLGTPRYMSPEIAAGKTVDNRSDIYSLGCVMYEALTGAPPFDADSALGTIHQHQFVYPKEPEFELSDKIKEVQLKQIILRCLQKDPTMRFNSCDELSTALMSSDDQAPAGSQSKNAVLHSWHSKGTEARYKWYIAGLPAFVAAALILVIVLNQDLLCQLGAVIFVQSKSRLLITQEKNFGQFLMHKNKFAIATKIFSDLLARYEKEHLADEFLSCNIDLAHCYFEQGQFDTAFKSLSKGLHSSWINVEHVDTDGFVTRCNLLIDALRLSSKPSQVELTFRAEMIERLLHDKSRKPEASRKMEIKLLGREIDYLRSLSREDIASRQTWHDPAVKQLLKAVADVISTPHFVMSEEQWTLLTESGFNSSALIMQAELNNPTTPESKINEILLGYYLTTYENNRSLLKEKLKLLMARSVVLKAHILEEMAMNDQARGDFADALQEIRRAIEIQTASRLIEGIENAEPLEIKILIAKGDLPEAERKRQQLIGRLRFLQHTFHPATDKQFVQVGRTAREFEIGTIETALSRIIDASVDIGAYKDAINFWYEMIDFDRLNHRMQCDKTPTLQLLQNKANALKPPDLKLLKSIRALVKDLRANI